MTNETTTPKTVITFEVDNNTYTLYPEVFVEALQRLAKKTTIYDVCDKLYHVRDNMVEFLPDDAKVKTFKEDFWTVEALAHAFTDGFEKTTNNRL